MRLLLSFTKTYVLFNNKLFFKVYKNNIEFFFNLVPIRKHYLLLFCFFILEKKIKISKRVEDERYIRVQGYYRSMMKRNMKVGIYDNNERSHEFFNIISNSQYF